MMYRLATSRITLKLTYSIHFPNLYGKPDSLQEHQWERRPQGFQQVQRASGVEGLRDHAP
eukprot:4737359-Karenia_brevis.AAC.1